MGIASWDCRPSDRDPRHGNAFRVDRDVYEAGETDGSRRIAEETRLLCMGTHTKTMSKNIAISDDVYRKLKREKGDRSFSDVIEEKLETGGRIADVTGTGVLDEAVYEAVADDIERLSRGTETRLEEEFTDENGR